MTKYWFKPKRYGLGATPVTWEGWALSLASLAVVLICLGVVASHPSVWVGAVAVVVVVVATAAVVSLSRLKTEGDWRWRWGDDGKA